MFRTQRPIHLPIRGFVGVSLGLFPLASDGDPLGVVEVLAPTAMIEDRIDVLSVLVGQSALLLDSTRVRTETERALAGMSVMLRLASELMLAKTATEAVRLTASACHEHLGAPVVGLLPDRDGWGWFLAASDGLGARRRSELRASLRGSNGEPGSRRLPMPSLRSRFREVSGCREVVAVRAGAGVMLLGDAPHGHEWFGDGVSSLLAAVLPRLGVERARRSGGAGRELGIAWAAHELKGPLAGARAALEEVYETAAPSDGAELVRRTRDELGQLSELIDPLLRWSSGNAMLKREPTDLVLVTREAIASSSLGSNGDRVVIRAPERLIVRADPSQLRSAIANVVRNALMYSPSGKPVRVRVEWGVRSARVVVRDWGPGIPSAHRALVFDPFKRGRAGTTRPGAGLGLFIARRVLEAHGGSVAIRPARSGATFVLEMPAEGWQLSAS